MLLAHGLLQDPGAVPLVIAVVGHRDPRPEYLPLLRQNFQLQLEQLIDTLPHTPLLMLNGLAEGMDSEAADVFLDVVASDRARRGALAPQHQLVGALPKTPEEYHDDFTDPEALARLDALLESCDGVLHPGNCEDLAVDKDADESACYGKQGVFLVRHCYLLFGFFDGIETKLVGGTSQTVAMQKGDIHPLFISVDEVLANKEPGALVIHHTPRLKPGSPLNNPGGIRFWSGSTSARESMAADGIQLPDELLPVPRRLEVMNAEAKRFELETTKRPFPYAYDQIEGLFTRLWCWADRTAADAKGSYERWCGILVASGFTLVLLTQLSPVFKGGLWAALLIAYKVFPKLQNGPKQQFISRRCLAECLTVQYLWIALSVSDDAADLFHTRSNTKDLGWIRNVLRGTRIQLLVYHTKHRRNHLNAIAKAQTWINGPEGQVQFLRKRIAAFSLIAKRWDHVTIFLGSIAIACAFLEDFKTAFAPFDEVIIVLLAALFAALSYSRLIGYAETADRYRRSLTMFERGSLALALANKEDQDPGAIDERQRIVIVALGREKLDELNDWVAGQLQRVYAPGA